KSLIENMGGTIEVTSELQKGSTFSFVIPLQEAPKSSKKSEPKKEDASVAEDFTDNLRILLAEDDPMIRGLMKIVFEQQGCNYTIAASGQEALSEWANGSFNVIILDIQMPDMDGFEVVSRIREEESRLGKHTPVLALTAHAFPEFKKRCLDAGMDGHISKPVRIETLFKQIEDCIAGCSV
ncbi:MAG TPA: response regulator, partial [Geopsychrobacteraceae bacterium]|nr:response regulator [Geopsychrobacteraceae bacterium]